MTGESISVPAGRLRSRLDGLCRAAGIDLAGAVALPVELPHRGAWDSWIEEGRHGGLGYMLRDPAARADPTIERPWARTALVFAQRYVSGWDPNDPASLHGVVRGRPWTDGVSRYARGRDYHDVLGGAIRGVLAGLREDLADDHGKAAVSLRASVHVDAGPLLERELAWLAGLGFFGRNTCLIHPRLGSGLFLGVALVGFEVEGLVDAPRPLVGPPVAGKEPPPGEGPANLCGNCSRCLDACPTGALVAPHVLDAGRCLSTWTIERRGTAPEDERGLQGGMIFGCDICQAVCPWNGKALRLAAGRHPPEEYRIESAHAELELEDLIALDAERFEQRFRRTPLWRAHPEGLRRNALVVAANTGRTDLADEVRAAAEADDPQTAETAAWAVDRLWAGGKP